MHLQQASPRELTLAGNFNQNEEAMNNLLHSKLNNDS